MKPLVRVAFALGAILAAVAVPLAASAVPVQGSINFGGNVDVIPPDFTLATALTFDNPVLVVNTTGDYAPLSGDVGVFKSITYDPTTPVVDLWVANDASGTYSFDLLEMTVVHRFPTFLALEGSGTLYAPNFDPTPGIWTLTAQASGNVSFSFSSTATAPAPEPGGLVLFLSGMTIVGFALRKQLSA